jgi:SAM-dependent methyltransferase
MSAKGLQAEPEDYRGEYDDEERFVGYWHQLSNSIRLKPASVLEIGIGNGFYSNYMRNNGYEVVTLDVDKRLMPKVQASVLDLPFKEGGFELVVAFEVLEHLPFSRFQRALSEICHTTNDYAILSLPDYSRTLSVSLDLAGLIVQDLSLPFLTSFRPQKHRFDGQHYWEIGKKGYGLETVIKTIEESGFLIEKTYRPNKAHHFRLFVLRKEK